MDGQDDHHPQTPDLAFVEISLDDQQQQQQQQQERPSSATASVSVPSSPSRANASSNASSSRPNSRQQQQQRRTANNNNNSSSGGIFTFNKRRTGSNSSTVNNKNSSRSSSPVRAQIQRALHQPLSPHMDTRSDAAMSTVSGNTTTPLNIEEKQARKSSSSSIPAAVVVVDDDLQDVQTKSPMTPAMFEQPPSSSTNNTRQRSQSLADTIVSTIASQFPTGRRRNEPHSLDDAISLTRPRYLPPKDPVEDRRHLREYERMMERSRRTERRKLEKHARLKSHEELKFKEAIRYWEEVVIPQWAVKQHDAKARRLWADFGLPPRIRGHVWRLCVGNTLSITEEVFKQHWENGKASEALVELVHRTMPELGFFGAGGPYEEELTALLHAFVSYRDDKSALPPEGLSYWAGMFLLNMSLYEAFMMMCNLTMAPVFDILFDDQQSAQRRQEYCHAFNLLMGEYLPELYLHIVVKNEVDVGQFVWPWFRGFYAAHTPVDVASRVWDMYFLDGDVALFRAGLAVLACKERMVLEVGGKEEVVKFLLAMDGELMMEERQFFDMVETRFSVAVRKLEHLLELGRQQDTVAS